MARHFAGAIAAIDDRVSLALLTHDWPGNVRELQHFMVKAVARRDSDAAKTIHMEHIDARDPVLDKVRDIEDEEARRALWATADRIAGDEGFERGTGLQKRAGEIVGVGEAQASKVYAELQLADAA